MWPGMVVSLIDRPWSRVLRAGRGRASLAWLGPAKERDSHQRDGSRDAIRYPPKGFRDEEGGEGEKGRF